MYQEYWGLSESPFKSNLDARYFYQAAPHDEALARLHFLVEQRRTLGLLTGDSGTGKSLLLEIFARELGLVNRQTARVNVTGVRLEEFLWLVAAQWGIEIGPAPTTFALWRAVADHITANRYQQVATILLLDDADEASAEVIDHIMRLAQFDSSREGQFTIVLTAKTTRLDRLGIRLLELAELRIDLAHWDQDDTSAYVKAAILRAGRTTPIFNEAALARLHELASGVPRWVKQLADLALLAGAGRNLLQIEADTIESVFQELGVVAPGGLTLVRAVQ